MSRTRQPSTRRIGAAERAITVLDTLAEAGELGTNEVARRTGMTPSTVSRQLGTLAASGLVERVDATGRYRLGIRAGAPRECRARTPRRPRGRAAAPRRARRGDGRDRNALRSRATRTRSRSTSCPARIRSSPSRGSAARRSRTRPRPGRSCSRSRAASSPTARSARTRPRTITDRQALASEIEQVRTRGYARAEGEREPGLTAIAAPIRSARGELEAIVALQGPSERFDDDAVETAAPAAARARRRGLARARLERLNGRARSSRSSASSRSTRYRARRSRPSSHGCTAATSGSRTSACTRTSSRRSTASSRFPLCEAPTRSSRATTTPTASSWECYVRTPTSCSSARASSGRAPAAHGGRTRSTHRWRRSTRRSGPGSDSLPRPRWRCSRVAGRSTPGIRCWRRVRSC